MSKELKALEIIKQSPTIYVGCRSDIYTRFSFECKEIEAALKALEIIIEKEVNVNNLKRHCIKIGAPYETYIEMFKAFVLYDLGEKMLTKKEYDLLKEVLL